MLYTKFQKNQATHGSVTDDSINFPASELQFITDEWTKLGRTQNDRRSSMSLFEDMLFHFWWFESKTEADFILLEERWAKYQSISHNWTRTQPLIYFWQGRGGDFAVYKISLVFQTVQIKKGERENMQGFPTAVGQPNHQYGTYVRHSSDIIL